MAKAETDIQSMTQAGLNLIKQAISIYDSDLRLVLANRRFQRMFDLPDSLVESGATFERTIRHLAKRGDYGEIDDIEAFAAERITQARAFEPHYFERIRSNGTTISIEGSPLRQGGWVAVYTDITEIKQQEALLRSRSADLSDELLARSEELSRTNRALQATVTALEEAKRDLTASQDRLNLTNAMTPAHIARVGSDGIYTYSNRKLSTVLPHLSNNVVGKHISTSLGADVYANVAPAFARTLQGDAPVLEFEDKESGRHIRVAFTPDIAKNGDIVGVYLLSMNVTDEVNARHALTHARRRELAAQLTSGLAHDFSNLLTIVLGQNERLERIAGLPPEVAEITATIKSAAKRGGVLLHGLSQLDAKRVLAIKSVNFAGFVDSLVQLATAAVPNGMTLMVENEISDENLMLDAGFAQDALLNLVLNAVEAMDATGAVTLRISREGDATLKFTVRDTGPGFTEDALKNALAPFYTSKTGKLGRGLGLSTAFDFAKSSGGTVRLTNRPEGGAAVILRIPYQVARPITPGMVLLVEDTVEIRETVRGLLQRMGHAVIEADNAEEARTLAEIPDVTHIVTDLMLGDGPTGFDFAQGLRAAGIPTPVLVITGLPAQTPLRQDVSKHYPVLQKPLDYDTLAAHFQKAAPYAD